jgi:hypothetical protein
MIGKSLPLRGACLASLGLVLAIAPVLVLIVPTPARADNPPAVEKLIQMNKKALEDYETLEWDTAKRTLLQALVFAKKSNIESHTMMARTYVHLGAIYVVGFKDKQKGLQSFARALEIDPSIRISKAMSTPELEELFAEAQKGAGAGGGGSRADSGGGEAAPPPPSSSGGRRRRTPIMESDAPPPSSAAAASSDEDDSGEPDLPAHINALECPTKDETPLERPVSIRCAVAANLPVAKLSLLYLAPGAQEFTAVPMEKTPKGWFVGKIPKKAVTGMSLRFYVEGRNAQGKAVVSNGRSESPNTMAIVDPEATDSAKEGGKKRREEENPLDPDAIKHGRRFGRFDASKVGLDTRFGNRRWWIGFAAGSGFGYAPASGLESLPDLSSRYVSGGAWAGLGHLAPEIGYQFNPGLAISIEGRHQYIPQTRHFAPYAATGAHAVLLKLHIYTKQARGRFFGAVAAGGGEGFRLIAHPAAGLPVPTGGGDPEYPNFKDTVRGGPVVAGVTGGYLYEISKGVSWMAEINLLAGLPKFAAVADLNTGFQINFGTTVPPPKVEEPVHTKKMRPPASQQEDDE